MKIYLYVQEDLVIESYSLNQESDSLTEYEATQADIDLLDNNPNSVALIDGVLQIDIERIKQEKIDLLGVVCNKKIRTVNDVTYSQIRWLEKSQNYQDIKHQYLNNLTIINAGGTVDPALVVSETDYNEAKDILSRKDQLRVKYHQLKGSLDSMTTEQLKAFDPLDDANWV